MNKPLLFFLVIIASIAAFIASGCHYMKNHGQAFYIALGTVVICLGAIGWLVVRRKSSPDVLHEMGLESWERAGFCFGAVPVIAQGRLALQVVYQNRYELPCEAELLFQPDDDAAKGGLKTLRAKVSCPGAGDGQLTLSWDVPPSLIEREVRVGVAADVVYSAGRGLLVRWRGGAPVGTTQSLQMGLLSLVVGQPSALCFCVPDFEATRGSAAVAAQQPQATVAASGKDIRSAPRPSAPPVFPDLGGQTRASLSAPTEAMPAMDAEVLSSKSLAALLESMSGGEAKRRQRDFVSAAKRVEAGRGMGLGILCILGGAALAAYGIGALVYDWHSPLRLFSAVMGSLGFLIGLVMLPASIAALSTASKVPFARTPEEAWRAAGEPALKSLTPVPNSWVVMVEWVAFPVAQRYQHNADDAKGMAQRWRDLRESLVGDVNSLRFGLVQARPHPMLGERVADLRMEVGHPGGTVWLRNAAVELEGHWFLATLEPIVEYGAMAGNHQPSSPDALKA